MPFSNGSCSEISKDISFDKRNKSLIIEAHTMRTAFLQWLLDNFDERMAAMIFHKALDIFKKDDELYQEACDELCQLLDRAENSDSSCSSSSKKQKECKIIQVSSFSK